MHRFPNKQNHPHAIHPNEMRRGGAYVPVRTSAQRSFHTKNRFMYHALCAGDERWMRPCGATRAGTQAPPLPISIKHCGVPLPHHIVHSIAHANRTVCPYRVAVILSIAQGWQVQRSLPWVTMQARRLPPWGLYSFSSHIITTRDEQMVSHTQMDFKRYNADGIGSPPRLSPG